MALDSSVARGAQPRLVLFARSLTQPAMIESLHRSLSSTRDLDYRTTSKPAELIALTTESERVVLLANCLLKEDIADLYNALPSFESRVAEGTLRILVLNSIRHPRLGQLLRSRCPIEILEIPMTLKALQYKMKNSLTFVHQSWQKAQTQKKKSEHDLGGEPKVTRAKPKGGSHEVSWQSGYDFIHDVWWIPNQRNIRNVVGAWLIDMLGPGPVVGTWEEMPGIEQSGERAWIWRPRSIAEEIFQTPGGRWIFFGKQPEFSWQKNLWAFVSKAPMLAYYREDSNQPEYVRFEYKPTEGLIFLQNSDHTKSLLQRIQSTFETRLGFGTTTPAEEPEEVSGGFESWDIDVEDESGGATHLGKRDDSSGAAWNNHTGAVGVDFGAKNLRVDASKPKVKPWRNALTPDEAVGAKLGLKEIENVGVKAGGKAFDQMRIYAEALRRNGETIPPVKDLFLYDVNEKGAVMLLPASVASPGDKLHLRIHLDTGQMKLECVMVWEFTSLEMELGGNRLSTGVFTTGDFDPLFSLLDHLDARKRELSDFFKTGRG